MGAGNTLKKPSFDYRPSKFSANEMMGFNAGNSRYQMNTPGGLLTLATLGGGNTAAAGLVGGQELASQWNTQKQLNQARPGYEQQAESQGMQAHQQSIASGTGGGGVQTSADTQAYNAVMAQYAALRQALEMQRMQQQMQMYGSMAQAAGMFYNPGAGAGAGAAAYQSSGPAGATGVGMMRGIYGGG